MSESPFEKLDYIDALRGWAIFGVMAIHFQTRLIRFVSFCAIWEIWSTVVLCN